MTFVPYSKSNSNLMALAKHWSVKDLNGDPNTKKTTPIQQSWRIDTAFILIQYRTTYTSW